MKQFIIFIAALLIIGGCKKDNDEKTVQKPRCRMSKLVTANGKEINITYNADGRYQKVDNGEVNQILTSVYGSSSIVVTYTDKSTSKVSGKSTILLNSVGMAYGNKNESYNSSGAVTHTINNVYEYNGTQLAKIISSNSTSTAATTYNWADGNLISSTSTSGVEISEYYTDKPIQQGDAPSVIYLTGGVDISLIIKNKNLTKSSGNNEYSYTFDSEGKINSLSRNGSLMYNIEYECGE